MDAKGTPDLQKLGNRLQEARKRALVNASPETDSTTISEGSSQPSFGPGNANIERVPQFIVLSSCSKTSPPNEVILEEKIVEIHETVELKKVKRSTERSTQRHRRSPIAPCPKAKERKLGPSLVQGTVERNDPPNLTLESKGIQRSPVDIEQSKKLPASPDDREPAYPTNTPVAMDLEGNHFVSSISFRTNASKTSAVPLNEPLSYESVATTNITERKAPDSPTLSLKAQATKTEITILEIASDQRDRSTPSITREKSPHHVKTIPVKQEPYGFLEQVEPSPEADATDRIICHDSSYIIQGKLVFSFFCANCLS